ASTAACFTALGDSFRPRPAGRSGCVSTRLTSWPASMMAWSARRANSGVPAKTIRISGTANSGNGIGHDTKCNISGPCNRPELRQGGCGGALSGPEGFALLLAQARLDAILFQDRQVFDKYLAHKVIELVLHANGKQSFGVELVAF